MKNSALSGKFSQKRIPTIIGLVILVVALIAGIFFLGEGPGVFAPRATPETTPKQVRITNVTDRSFTVSFLTDAAATGFVKYGSEPKKLDTQASDNRDQVSGSVGKYKLHYVTIRGVQPSTQYYFLIGTEKSTFDNEGAPFSITTASPTGTPPAARTISGSVLTPAGAPADGAIVYITGSDMQEMSSLVSTSGSWAVPLSDARTAAGAYAEIQDTDEITIYAQGESVNLYSTFTAKVADAHPFPAITLGSSDIAMPEPEDDPLAEDTDLEDSAEPTDGIDSTDSADTVESIDENVVTGLGTEAEKEVEQPVEENHIVDLNLEEEQTVTTSNPIIKGRVAPATLVKITINSENVVEADLISDENGEFILDLTQLEESLEPGEHTATFTYTDETGEEVTVTKTFWVTLASNLIPTAEAQENQVDGPYSTNRPYPMADATPTPTPEPTSEPTPDATATESATSATPSATPATDSAETSKGGVATDSSLMQAGSVGTTFALVFGGLFFITSGVWSFWISNQLEKKEA